MRLRQVRQQKGIRQKELASKVGTDEPMMSRFENYKCLPIPEMLKAICKELDCGVYEIYDYPELYVDTRKLHREIKVVGRQEPSVYKLSVRLPEEAREKLTQHNLEKCGYHSLKDFIWHCFQRYVRQLAAVNAKENRPESNSEAVLGNGDAGSHQ